MKRWPLVALLVICCIFRSNCVNYTEIREATLTWLLEGQYKKVIGYFDEVERNNRTNLLVDYDLPSLSTIKGVAYHGLRQHELAAAYFNLSVHHNPKESRAWINLGRSSTNTLMS